MTYQEYPLKLYKISAFPTIEHPKVIWISTNDKKNDTINLIKQLDKQFNKIGFKKEKSYTPHITIGRVKQVHNMEKLVKTLFQLKKHYIGEMQIKNIKLKSSQLTPNGPIYSTEYEYKI